MEVKPKILFGSVMHKRFFPKVNEFRYKIYYLALPLSKINGELENSYLKYNRWGPLSFYDKDHGDCSGNDLRIWADQILKENNIDTVDGEIILVTMPRVFGYVFNPVSFWYCYDSHETLQAVICEVNNTFGEAHTYICNCGEESLTKDQIMRTKKVFHVSPFLQREGGYMFRFAINEKKMGAWIDYYDKDQQKQLVTTLVGDFEELNEASIKKAFWSYPLITIKAIFLIHWQAVKLFVKRIEYVPKPVQNKVVVTRAKTHI